MFKQDTRNEDSYYNTRWTILPNAMDKAISFIRGVCLFFFLSYIIYKTPIFNVDRVNSYQTPQSLESALGLHCLQMSLLWEDRDKWVYIWEFEEEFKLQCCL